LERKRKDRTGEEEKIKERVQRERQIKKRKGKESEAKETKTKGRKGIIIGNRILISRITGHCYWPTS